MSSTTCGSGYDASNRTSKCNDAVAPSASTTTPTQLLADAIMAGGSETVVVRPGHEQLRVEIVVGRCPASPPNATAPMR